MRLDDEITALDSNGEPIETLEAHVGTVTVGIDQDGGPAPYHEELRALILPSSHAGTGSRWRWRNEEYTQHEPAIVRRQHGSDHHYTLRLRRYTNT